MTEILQKPSLNWHFYFYHVVFLSILHPTAVVKITSLLTGVSLAEHLNGGGHFFLADAFILLPLGGGLEPLPGQRAQVEVHENVA